MKLFVIAALVAVAAAGRLEHLERGYLPPNHGSNNGFGSHSAHGSFGVAGSGLQSHNDGSHFAGATSNQYLPPDHGPLGSNGGSQFAGSLNGFGAQSFRSQQYSGHQGAHSSQYSAPSSQYSAPNSQYSAHSESQYSPQSAATSRQYLAPHTGSYQQPPQQAFDEQTGYHY